MARSHGSDDQTGMRPGRTATPPCLSPVQSSSELDAHVGAEEFHVFPDLLFPDGWRSRWFGVDLLEFAVISNHLQFVLRNRPDVVALWSDEEVARRWWTIFPQRREKDGAPALPQESDLGMITNNPQKLAEVRKRLSNSGLMSLLPSSSTLCKGTQRIQPVSRLHDDSPSRKPES